MTAWLRRVAPAFPVLSVAISAGLSAWALGVKPDRAYGVLIPAAIYIGLILLVETRWQNDNSRAADGQRLLLRCGFFFGGALVMLAGPGTKLAIVSGLVDASLHDPMRHVGGMLAGMSMVVFGNFLPKLVSPWRIAEEPFDWQGVHRFCGRVFMLAGAVVAWVWLTWPTQEAAVVTRSAFLAAAILAVGRKFHSLATWRRTGLRP